MTNKPNIDELTEIISGLPELAAYRRMAEAMKHTTEGYSRAMQAMATAAVAFGAASASLQKAVRAAEDELIRKRASVEGVVDPVPVGALQQALRRVVEATPAVELPYAPKPTRNTAQWKTEINRNRGRS